MVLQQSSNGATLQNGGIIIGSVSTKPIKSKFLIPVVSFSYEKNIEILPIVIYKQTISGMRFDCFAEV